MAHVVLCWELGAGFGHLVPLRMLARSFLGRGHRVSALVRDTGPGADLLRSLGVRVLAAPQLGSPPRRFSLSLTYSDNLLRNGYWHADALSAALSSWRALLARTKPDMLITDHAPTALLASRGTDCRAGVLGMGFTLPPQTHPMPGLQPWLPIPESHLREREQAFLDTVNPTLGRLGLPGLTRVSDIQSDALRLLCAFPELDHHADRRGDTWWGPLFDPETPPEPDWPGGGKDKAVFVYMSRTNRFLAPVLQNLARRGLPVLAYVRDAGGAVRGPVEAGNVRYLEGLVNLAQVATHCRAVVSQGGFGSIAALLGQGVPLLVCPLELEQAQLAWRLRARGLAHGLSLFSSEAGVEAGLAQLLDDPRGLPGLERYVRDHAGYDPRDTAEGIARHCEEGLH